MAFADFITHPLARGHQGRPRHALSPARAPAASSRAPSSRHSTNALLPSAGTQLSRSCTSSPSRSYNRLSSIGARIAFFSASVHTAAHSCRAGVQANAGPDLVQAAYRHLHQAHHHARQVQAAREGARALPVHDRGGGWVRAQPRVPPLAAGRMCNILDSHQVLLARL
jgi:hypothetical protein